MCFSSESQGMFPLSHWQISYTTTCTLLSESSCVQISFSLKFTFIFHLGNQCSLPDPISIPSGKYATSLVDQKVRQIVNLCMGRIRLPGRPVGCTYHDINKACPFILAKSFATSAEITSHFA